MKRRQKETKTTKMQYNLDPKIIREKMRME